MNNTKRERRNVRRAITYGVFLVQIVVLTVSMLSASTPKIVTYRTQKDFEKGKPRGVSINSKGEVLLAPSSAQILNPELPFVWCGAPDSQGNLFVAVGGNTGLVYKVDSANRSNTFFDAEKFQVYAIAADNQNNVYVATSPQGKVHRIPKTGNVDVKAPAFFDPEEVYIWGLVIDSQNNLFVATGEKGKIYKVDSAGRSSVFYEGEDTHIRRMAFDSAGNLVVGTSNKGIVLRLDTQGRAFVLYDSPMVEITDILIDHAGNIFAAGTGEERLQPPPAVGPVPVAADAGDSEEAVSEEDEAIDVQVQNIAGASPSSGKQGSEVYRIDKDGVVKTIWRSRSERVFAMTANGDDNIIVGTGDPGRLRSLNANGDNSLLLEFDDLQITALGKGANGEIFVGTSNAGKVYRLSRDFNSKGEYLSDVMDATVASQWGAVNWDASLKEGTAVTLYSRSGNTERPDKTWSPWSAKYSSASGEAIVSAPARFIQFKAELSTSDARNTPILREMSFSYLQKNLPPEINEITILPPSEYYPDASNNTVSDSHLGSGTSSSGSSNQYAGRKSFQKGYRSVSWKSRDDNGDNLSFDLFYSSPSNPGWKKLVKDFRGSIYSWDSELMPDGDYMIKILAKDALSNPPALSLNFEKVSPPFKVDNSGPRVSDIKVIKGEKKSAITFTVEDTSSLVTTVEYGLNVDEWKLVYPVDGICDSKIERFEISIDNQKGNYSLVVKAKDALENIGFGKTNIEL